MSRGWPFYGNCVGLNGDRINEMRDNAKAITQGTFRKYVANDALRGLRHALGYTRDFTLSNDWHVGYYKSTFTDNKGQTRRCVYMVHSAIEYVFIER